MPPPPSLAASVDDVTYVDRLPSRDSASLRDTTFVGIGLIVASTVFFSVGDIAAKELTETLPPLQVAWLRYLVFLALVVPALFAARGRQAMATARPGLQVLRALAVVVSSVFFMFGLGHLQVAEATAINFMSPIFITALSIPLLGETVGVRRWSAAAVGFAGVMLIVQPGTQAFQLAALYPLAAALVWAGAAIATRFMSTERPQTTLAWSALIGFLVLSTLVPFDWHAVTWRSLGIGVLTGIASTIGHWLVIRGYRLASASVLAPYSYVQLAFASLFGFVAFGSAPGTWTLVGGGVIALSGLYTAYRERVRASLAPSAGGGPEGRTSRNCYSPRAGSGLLSSVRQWLKFSVKVGPVIRLPLQPISGRAGSKPSGRSERFGRKTR
jgi:drug/metabolite transporter (DMT)-like permease